MKTPSLHRLMAIVTSFVAASAIFASCGPEEEPEPQNVAVSGVTLNQSTIALETGSTTVLTATVNPSNATNKAVTWSSSNSSVASVLNGTVTAVAAGTATITATAEGKSASCEVTVTQKIIPVKSIRISPNYLEVYESRTNQLEVIFTPEDATDKSVKWSSADETIATVDENGLVTGVNRGTTTVTAIAGEQKSTVEVQVFQVTIESVRIEPADTTFYQGDTVQFRVFVDPPDARIKSQTWSCDSHVLGLTLNEEGVGDFRSGRFIGRDAGTAEVRVVVNSVISATCNVTVLRPDYMDKEKAALMAIYNAHKNHWPGLSNWGADGPVTSAWEGVEMDATGTHVKGLQLRDVYGKLPKEIGDLTELETLSIICDVSYTMPKSECGPLPKEIGNLKKLNWLVMYDYPLTGKLPESLFSLTNLETLSIVRSRYMDKATLPSSIGNLTNLTSLTFDDINLSGSLPPELGNLSKLTSINLRYNGFTGSIPSSYAGLINLETCRLQYNKLSGTLPATLARIERFPLIWGPMVESNNFSQEDIRKSKIPAPISPVVTTISGKKLDIEQFIKGNKYTVLFDVASDFSESTEYLTNLENLYKKGKSKGLGVISYYSNNSSNASDITRRDNVFKDVLKKSGAEWDSFIRHMYEDYPDGAPFYAQNGMGMYPNGRVNQMVIIGPDGTVDYTTLVDSDVKNDVEHALKYLESVLNVSMSHYESKSYTRDGTVKTLQKASTGKGLDLVITGDAFSDRDITGGTFEKAAKQAMNDFFAVEPMKSLKGRFNVYMVEAVSKHEEYFNGCSTVFSGAFGSGTAVGGDNKKVLQYAKKAVKDDTKMDNVVVLVLMNSYRDGGTCYMQDAVDGSVYAGGASVAYVTYKDVTVTGGLSNLAGTIIHEVAGHGLGKLADEYSYLSYGEITSAGVTYIKKVQQRNWYMNVSLTSDPSKTPWSKFIGDSAFASENIGVYEGGYTFWSGVWRPTEQSVMNNDNYYSTFNAPCRSQIYTRIMKLSEGESWNYDYDAFVKWEKAHPTSTRAATRSAVETIDKTPVHIPPVVVGKTWKEVINE